MFRRAVLVFCLVTCSLSLAEKVASKKHTVIALLVKNGNHSASPPEVRINGQKIMNKNFAGPAVVPKQGAQLQGPLPQGPPPQGPQLAAAMQQNTLPPQPVAPVVKPLASPPLLPNKVLIKPKDKPAAEKEKEMKKLKDELFPCEDYSPICHYYGKDAQCRDVWMQRHCRKFCGFCDVPLGVFLGCVDMKHCHKFAKSDCMHDWVKKTCKAKCGACGYSREAASNILIGKKRGSVLKAKTHQSKDSDETPVVTKPVVKQEKPVILPSDHDTDGSAGSGSEYDDDVNDDDDDVPDDDDDDDYEDDEDDDDAEDDEDDAEASGSGSGVEDNILKHKRRS